MNKYGVVCGEGDEPQKPDDKTKQASSRDPRVGDDLPSHLVEEFVRTRHVRRPDQQERSE